MQEFLESQEVDPKVAHKENAEMVDGGNANGGRYPLRSSSNPASPLKDITNRPSDHVLPPLDEIGW